MEYKNLVSEFRLKNKVLKNRMVMPPMEARLSRPDGSTTREMCAYYAERARGGVGMVIVENTFVDTKASRSSLVSSGLYNDHMIAGKYNLAEAIKSNGAVAIIQLSHGGRQANAYATGLDCVGPSAIPSAAVGRMPHALTKEEIIEIEDCFAEAARRAKFAGFDGVEIHCAHGYLISSFLAPAANKREDEYGGSEENRGRFASEILAKVRKAVGDDFIVGMRINGSDFIEDGLTIDASCRFAHSVEHLIDYVHVSAAFYESNHWQISPLYVDNAPLVDLAGEMKKAVSVPVIAVNSITPEMGEQALADGKADLVSFGRALIADPEMPNKIMSGNAEDIRPCCRGNEGCISLFFLGCPIRCEVNGRCGRELDYPEGKASVTKNIAVVGGGIAGMQAAVLASERGHKVTLFEKTDVLGGHFTEGTIPSFKHEGRKFLEYLVRQVEKSDIDVRFGTSPEPEDLKSYDDVIVAVGSEYSRPGIPGIEKSLQPDYALENPDSLGKKVAVIGGGLIGTETALYLAEKGHSVSVVEMLEDIAMADEGISQAAVRIRADEAGIEKILLACVKEIADGRVIYEQGGSLHETEADSIVCALGLKAKADETEKYRRECRNVHIIGDCAGARKIFSCTQEAWAAVYGLEKN